MSRSIKLCALALAVAVGSCSKPTALEIRYTLDKLPPTDVVRVETLVAIDATMDMRQLFADQPYRSVAQGVGYEVRDFDGSGQRKLLVSFDATLGYVFSRNFHFSLLPPVGESPPPLTLVSQAVGASATVSNVVTTRGAFAPGGVVDVVLTDARCGAAVCVGGLSCCSGHCDKVDTDVANCGRCGNACGATGDSCSGSLCRCAGGSACQSGQTCCPGLGCINLSSDPFHCGACGKACNPGESCTNGQCTCGSVGSCTGKGPTALCCNNGMCSTDGTCPCGIGPCVAPKVCCGGSNCVDPTTDNSNCGTCSHACTQPLTCGAGACKCNGVICAAGDTCCPSGCANTSNDPNNCGQCGRVCNPGETCGTTANSTVDCLCGSVACAAGQTCCNGSCVDTTGDTNNCGACNNKCRAGESCLNSHCSCNGGNPCTANQTCCGPATPGGAGCFDLSNGPEHCGACNNPPCAPGQMCQMGMCAASSCNPACDHGNSCVSGQCLCNGNPGCTGNLYCCGSSGCVDLLSDPNNCTKCGNACAPQPLCCGGVCKSYSTSDCGQCGNNCNGVQCCLCLNPPSCGKVCPLACGPAGGV
jgi:hypothetical protein